MTRITTAFVAALAMTLALGPTAQAAEPAAPAGSAAADPAAAARRTEHRAMVVLKVARPEKARTEVLAQLDKLGGYPLLVTDDKLELKVPPAKLDALLEVIGGLGLVVDKARTRNDRTEELERLRARLAGRRTLLKRLRGFLAEADVNATVRIESQMLALVQEAEGLAGQLRLAADAVAFARVTLSFTWRQSAPMRYARSPFPWLDGVGLDQLLREFGQ